jgi:ssRNA-specific RNase YbeY (16S rRNA maturation enzyme)
MQVRLDRLLLHGVCHLIGGEHDDEVQHSSMIQVDGGG